MRYLPAKSYSPLENQTMEEHFEKRIAHLRKSLENQNQADQEKSPCTNLLVTSLPNVRYLTGFTGSSAALLVSLDDCMIISDGRYTEQLSIECPGLDAVIRPIGGTMTKTIAETMKGRFAGDFLFEQSTVAHSQWLELTNAFDGKLIGSTNIVEDLRAIKDEVEIELIRKSVAINQTVFQEVCQWIDAGTTERDVAAEIEYRGRKHGADGCSFEPIVATGANSALAHYRPGNVKLNSSPFTLIDWGLNYHGYASDLTRNLITGPVPKQYEEIYNVTLRAQQAALAAIKPGMEIRALDAVARDVITEAGYGPQFSHSLGHGIGLEIHEGPGISQRSNGILKEGMVITIEPGIYIAGMGGVRIEDDVWVTATGGEVISNLPKALK